jgi:hypothetical protein
MKLIITLISIILLSAIKPSKSDCCIAHVICQKNKYTETLKSWAPAGGTLVPNLKKCPTFEKKLQSSSINVFIFYCNFSTASLSEAPLLR